MGRFLSSVRSYRALLVIGIVTIAIACCAQTVTVGATDVFNQVCTGAAASSAACTSTKDDIVSRTVGNVVNLVTFISGIVAVIMVMVGGFMYLTSNGDAGKLSEAKNTIVFTLVGLAVIILARFIIQFVLSRV